MRIKELYYRFKYRPKKGQSGATGIIISKNKKKGDFEKQLDNIACVASPCYKSNHDVLNYIQSKYILKATHISEAELTTFKINYILNHCPQVLQTPEIKFSENGKLPGRNKFLEIQENNQKRFFEARQYPFEKLGIDIHTYSFEYEMSDGFVVVFKIICENKNDDIFITAATDRRLEKDEDKIIRRIVDEITVYKGIKQEDIDNRTRKFIVYGAAVMNLEKLKGADEE